MRKKALANLFRMRQFYGTYSAGKKVAPLVRQLPWTLSRSVSPALMAEYQTRLPDKKLLQAKLHEFYQLTAASARPPKPTPAIRGPA